MLRYTYTDSNDHCLLCYHLEFYLCILIRVELIIQQEMTGSGNYARLKISAICYIGVKGIIIIDIFGRKKTVRENSLHSLDVVDQLSLCA